MVKIKDIEKITIKQIDWKHINLKTILGLYLNYKEIVNYLVFGALAMAVNFISYFLFARILKIDEVISSGFSWFCSVLFAYITNKLFVFESKTETKKAFFKEMVSFLACRVLSGILCDVGTFALMVKVLKINDIFSKIVTQVMVVIVNYVLSKLVIFRKNNQA